MKNVKGTLAQGLMVFVAALSMVGCGKNSDNNQAAVVNPYGYPGAYSSCAGCVGNTTPIASGIAQNQQLGEGVQLQFFGTSGATYSGYTQGSYSQVAAQGVLHMGQLGSQCGLPAGDYQITTQSAPAVMQGNYIQGLSMVGTGPTQVMIQFTRIYFTSPTMFQADGVMWGPGAMTQCSFRYY